MGHRPLAVAVLLLLSPVPTWPAVTTDVTGFVVKLQATVAAPPETVFRNLVEQVGSWWDPAHTFSGDARNLSIEPRPGGCFCERLPDGGGVEHLRVLYVAPGRLLRLSGALGPLQASGLAGSLTWTLSKGAEGTHVDLVYSVGGHMEGGFGAIAPAVDAVIGAQLQRLKRFTETGAPTAPASRKP
jgi:uncharacterized protein YndB with AHSA1/START domain